MFTCTYYSVGACTYVLLYHSFFGHTRHVHTRREDFSRNILPQCLECSTFPIYSYTFRRAIFSPFALLWWTISFVHVRHCTALRCTALHCSVLYCTAVYCTVMHCAVLYCTCLLYTSPSPRDLSTSRMPSSA